MTLDPVEKQLDDLARIRSLMEQSSKFLTLSGLSGVSAGAVGIAAYFIAREELPGMTSGLGDSGSLLSFSLQALLTLLCALGAAAYFSSRMARRQGVKVWTPATKYLVVNLFIPLAAGGAFCGILLHHALVRLIAPSMLIFYGLALLNASKYTLREIRYLGLSEICLGLIGAFWLDYGLLLWCAGFGVLHVLYGSMMYLKYEK